MSKDFSFSHAKTVRVPWLEQVSAVPARLFALVFGSPETFQEDRIETPHLRPIIYILLCLGITAVVAGVGLLLSYRHLGDQLERKLSSAEQILDVSWAAIEREMTAVGTASALVNFPDSTLTACPVSVQQTLTRAALDSVLVGQFFVQNRDFKNANACGSFGPVEPYWQMDMDKKGLQIVPSQNLQAHIAVGIVRDSFLIVGVIDPRQLIDRLPGNQGSTAIDLVGLDGLTLASSRRPGNNETLTSLLFPEALKAQKLKHWPLYLHGKVTHHEIFSTVVAQIGFWILSAILMALLVLFVINRQLKKYSSRAWRLRRALKKRRFAPVVQPIVNAVDGQCIGMEILMRWKHPTRGLLAPAEFIDYAERSGLIVPMSDLLMRLAQRQLGDIATANPHFYFSFNITPTQLRTPNFSQSLLQIFDGDPIGPAQVLLELTERDLVDQQVRDELGRLRAFGFKIAIDDFGTGQSSLAVLQDLVIDKLKIDRAFVNTVSSDRSAQPVLDAIIDLAHRLKITIVAEGIETELQQQYLVSKGVQALQGYRFARPLTPIDFNTWLANQHSGQENSVQISDSLAQVLTDLQVAREVLERNRWHYGKRHRQCLLGNELVSWLAKRYDLRRAEALKLGQRLLAKGFLVHVFEEHDLEDAPFFYRLLSLQAVQEARNVVNASGVTLNQLVGWLKGPFGVVPGKRASALLRFSQAVKSTEVIDALVKAGGLSRAQALAGGVQLMRAGLLKHPFDEQGFVDSRTQVYYLTLK